MQAQERLSFGIVGLGRIGHSLALQAIEKGHRVVGHDRSSEVTRALAERGLEPADSVAELARRLEPPRVVLVYVPQGPPVDEVLRDLAPSLDEGDVVVDGGNSHWKESARRQAEMKRRGLGFVDAGTSGGVRGARHGACFMVGGEDAAVRVCAPVLRALAVEDGFRHVGPPGAGHFVKLVHNAVEFGMVQSIAEGVEMMAKSDYDLDLPGVLRTWNRGSVVRSWLVELMEEQLRHGPPLDALDASRMQDTKEGKWYVEYALEKEVPAFVLTMSELMFYRYRDPDSVAGKAVALMRHGFGEHALPTRERGGPTRSAGRSARGRG